MPHTRPLATLGTDVVLDAGDYPGLLDHGLQAVDYGSWCQEAATVPDGIGSWASRSTAVGGAAVLDAARTVADKARRVAADLLGVSEDKVVLGDGRARVRRAESQSVSFAEIAAACDPLSSLRRGKAPRLRADGLFSTEHMTYPYGVHLAQVEVYRQTGAVAVHRYCLSYEVGKAIHPKLVEARTSVASPRASGVR